MSTLLGLGAIVVLIAANGYFVAAEFAFVAADRNALERMAADGDARARRSLRVLRRLSFMLSGAQLGITATSLLVGFIAQPVFRDALDPVLSLVGLPEGARGAVSLAVGFALATVGQMVVGELAPKNLAIARPEPVVRRLASSVLAFLGVAGPVIRFFDSTSNRLLRAIGIEPVEELSGVVSVEELDVIVEESASVGSLTGSQAQLLERALAFPDLTATEVAIPRSRVRTIGRDASCLELRELMATAHSRFPVVGEEDDVVGVVHSRALLHLPRDKWSDTAVAELADEPVFVPETMRLPNLLRILRSTGTELAIVVDEHGTFAGVVTAEDLVEELVGDISDESDPLAPGSRSLGGGRWSVPGSWRLDEIERATGLVLPDGDYDTVAGFTMAALGRLAKVGDEVHFPGGGLRVIEMDRRAIARVLLESPLEGSEVRTPQRGDRRRTRAAPVDDAPEARRRGSGGGERDPFSGRSS